MTFMQQASNRAWQQGLLEGHWSPRLVHAKKSQVQSAEMLRSFVKTGGNGWIQILYLRILSLALYQCATRDQFLETFYIRNLLMSIIS